MAAIHWDSAVSGDWASASDWSGGVVPGAGDDVTIAAAGPYTVTIDAAEAAHSLTVDDASATVGVYNTLSLGGRLSLAAGALQLDQGGAIVGGTLSAAAGAVFDWAGGAIDGVTIDGPLNLTTGRADLVAHGLTVTGASGTGPGVINLAGSYTAELDIVGQTLDNVTINMGDGQRYSQATLNLFDQGDTGNVLTLGSKADIVHTTGSAGIGQDFNFGNESLVNDGTISAGAAGGSFSIGVDNITNNGVISVTNGDRLTLHADSFTEGTKATFTVGAGSTLFLGVDLTTAQLSKITDSGVIAFGRYGVTLTNAGATFTVGPGTGDPSFQLDNGGEILGGKIVDKGSGMFFGGGTLAGVTFDGTMDLTERGAYVFVNGGLTLAGVNGTGPGTIDLGNSDGALNVDGGETLDNATLDIGAYQGCSFNLFDPSHDSPVLTLGAHFDIVHTNDQATLNAALTDGNGTIVNDGTITASAAGGTFDIQYGTFVNNGVIAVSNGDTLDLDPASFTEGSKGSISVASGGVLNLAVPFTTAQLTAIADNGGTIGVQGVLTNTGTSLDVGPGTADPVVALRAGGVVSGGTIVDEGSGIHFNGGTLSNVTFDGVVNLAPTYSTLYVENGFTATGLNGQGPGQINLGFLAFFDAEGGETLDDATLDMGYGGNFALFDPNDATPVLTLGPNFQIVQDGNGGSIGDRSGFADDTIVNDGAITAAFGGSQNFLIDCVNFTNNGFLVSGGGEIVYLQPGTLTNLSGTTLTGGSYEADGGSTIELNQNVAIVTDKAILILSGAGSSIQSFNTASGTEVGLESTLAAIGAGGALELLNGRGWTTSLAMTNAGTLILVGGAFAAPSLANSGTVTGFGALSAALSNTGALVVQAGQTLDMSGGSLTNLSAGTLSGGTYTVGAGATLQLKNNVSIVTLRATVDLTGAGATIQSLNTTTSGEVSLAASLKTIGLSGVLEVAGGAKFTATNSISNAGTLELGGGTFSSAGLANSGALSGYGVVNGVITDSGTISAQAGHTLNLQNATISSLAGATFVANAGSTFQLTNNATFQTLDFTVVLNGVGSVIQSFQTETSTELTFEQGSTGLSATGVLEVLGGRNYTTTNVYANSGRLQLAGGRFSSGALTDAAGSTLTGFGTVASVFSDSGVTKSSGGALAFTGKGDTFAAALAGTTIDFSGGTDLLQSGSSLTATTVGLSGGAAVTLAANQSFAGKLTQASGTTLALGVQTLTLGGAGSTLAGTVSGTGTLAFSGGSQAIGAGAALTVAHWSLTGGTTTLAETLTYKGAFTQGAGATLTLTAGDTLFLTGAAALSGLIHGASRVKTSAATVGGLIIGGTTTLEAAGPVDQTGTVTVGDKSSSGATLTIDAGLTWAIAAGGGIARGASSKSAINVKGTLTATEAGTSVVAVRVVDTGSIVATTGTFDFTGALIGTGTMTADAGATLETDLTAAATLSMVFNGAGATLALEEPAQFAATIDGFAVGDTIHLLGHKATSATLGANDTLVIDQGSKHVATLQLAGTYTGDTFTVVSDGAGGATITLAAAPDAPPSHAIDAPQALSFVSVAAGMAPRPFAAPAVATTPPHALEALFAAPRIQAA